MTVISSEIIDQIKSATDVREIEIIINHSIQRVSGGGALDKRAKITFMGRLLISLRSLHNAAILPAEKENTNSALIIVDTLLDLEYENLL